MIDVENIKDRILGKNIEKKKEKQTESLQDSFSSQQFEIEYERNCFESSNREKRQMR